MDALSYVLALVVVTLGLGCFMSPLFISYTTSSKKWAVMIFGIVVLALGEIAIVLLRILQ